MRITIIVAAGLALLGVRRARACLEWRNRVEELARRIRDAFLAELDREIDHTVEEVRACSRVRYSSSTVRGRKAFRHSGRSKAIRTVRPSVERW